jgi:hypothetical protein
MNDDAQLITAALDRRFARAATPACPEGAWRAAAPEPAEIARPARFARGLAYAAALLAVVGIAGVSAQAAGGIKDGYLRFLPFIGSSKPLMPLIHRADRLSIAEAQRRMPFPIVVPAGLPAGTQFQYAHVVSERPVPRVSLNYQARIANRYYWINVNETTAASGPAAQQSRVAGLFIDGRRNPKAFFAVRTAGGKTKQRPLPLRSWKHGNIVMEMLAWGLPDAMREKIVRANTQ